MDSLKEYLDRLRHDVIKRLAWPARDLCAPLEEGKSPSAADVEALRRAFQELPDGAGRPVGAVEVLAAFAAEAPEPARALLHDLQNLVAAANEAVGDPAIGADAPALKRAVDAALRIEARVRAFVDAAKER